MTKLLDLFHQGMDTLDIAEHMGGVSKGWTEAKPLCSIHWCGKPHCAQGYCEAHYRRLRRHGSPLGGRTSPGEPMRWVHEVALRHDGEGCLTWPFSDNGDGYGSLKVGGKTVRANRYICELAHGKPPTPEHEAAHSCGKGHEGCISPIHLGWKTHAENCADKLLHDTHNRGERHGLARLTEADVLQIMALKGVESQNKLAKRFGVTHGAIGEIHQGRNWSWLTKNRSVADEVTL